jgi:hypothetical protein
MTGCAQLQLVYSGIFKLLQHLAATLNVLSALTATKPCQKDRFVGSLWGAVNKLFPAMYASAGDAGPYVHTRRMVRNSPRGI